MCRSVCAVWEVSLSDAVYKVEFEHGTTTGKRVVYVNGQEVLRRDWMFRLVGSESFPLGLTGTKAVIQIQALEGFSYEYSLLVNGLTLQKFTQNRSRTTQTWFLVLDQVQYRMVFEKDTLDVWCNGQKMLSNSEFVEDGSQTRFVIGEHEIVLKAFTEQQQQKGRRGITYCLLVDGAVICS
ncbi:unnamed protein product [Knipowitschia caucasica]